MTHKLYLAISAFALILLGSGCSSGLLPRVDQVTKSKWVSFADAKDSFDKIVPNQTTAKELIGLGFDPFATPNVKLITYLEIMQRFMPNQSVRFRDLDPDVQSCLRVKSACQGYEVSPKIMSSVREGNVALDLLNFRRKTVSSGWNFLALVVLKNDLVVYKLWGGQPNIVQIEDKKNPLGPLQDFNVSKFLSL